ncbi:MAG: hypothetical protein M9949_11360 [Candidatus Kapabacteria bacterium]|nr:hypothetical protein [Candidatus Kapabacteria bacterium]
MLSFSYRALWFVLAFLLVGSMALKSQSMKNTESLSAFNTEYSYLMSAEILSSPSQQGGSIVLDQSIVDALLTCRQKLYDAEFSYNSYNLIFKNILGLAGYANWCDRMKQTKDSLITKIQNYLDQHNIQIPQLQAPEIPGINDPIELLKNIYKYEILSSISLETASKLPALENDNPSLLFIRNLVDEQTEEEATASELLERSKVFYTGQPPKYGLDGIDESLK